MQKALLAEATDIGQRAWLLEEDWPDFEFRLLWASLSIAEPQVLVASSVKWKCYFPYRIFEIKQIKCLHRHSVSTNSLNKHLLSTYSFRCCAN